MIVLRCCVACSVYCPRAEIDKKVTRVPVPGGVTGLCDTVRINTPPTHNREPYDTLLSDTIIATDPSVEPMPTDPSVEPMPLSSTRFM